MRWLELISISCAIFFGRCAVPKNIHEVPRAKLDSLYSAALSEYRRHAVYLPPGFQKGKSYPVVWGTDGIQPEAIRLLDSLIGQHRMHPIVYASSCANTRVADSTTVKTGDGKAVHLVFRNFDYIRNNASGGKGPLGARFDQHMAYYVNEFMPAIERQLALPDDAGNRYYYGVSNGAGFGLQLAHSYPDLISSYLCCSPFGADPEDLEWKTTQHYPTLFWCFGDQEPTFLQEDAAWLQERYAESGSAFHLQVFAGGHASAAWNQAFIAWCLENFGVR